MMPLLAQFYDWWTHVFSLWGFLIIVVLGTTIGTALGTVAKNWRKARESEQLAVLKQNMIQPGMSVEEIERVLAAGRSGRRDD